MVSDSMVHMRTQKAGIPEFDLQQWHQVLWTLSRAPNFFCKGVSSCSSTVTLSIIRPHSDAGPTAVTSTWPSPSVTCEFKHVDKSTHTSCACTDAIKHYGKVIFVIQYFTVFNCTCRGYMLRAPVCRTGTRSLRQAVS